VMVLFSITSWAEFAGSRGTKGRGEGLFIMYRPALASASTFLSGASRDRSSYAVWPSHAS
jgi:hypothetical protein